MFSTITGIRFKSKNVEDLLKEVHKKLGVEKDSIYIHNEYVGFFNTNDKEEDEVLDYKRGLIVKKTPPPGSNIYKHLLCDEEELQIEEKEETLSKEEIYNLVASLDNPNDIEKLKICENIEVVIRELFKDNL